MNFHSAFCWRPRQGRIQPATSGRRIRPGLALAACPWWPRQAAKREFSSYAKLNEDGSLRVETREVHLYGIYIPPAAGQHCRTFFSPPVCGSRAALPLEFRIRGFVHCQQKSVNRDRGGNAVCFVDRKHAAEGEDLGADLIRQGLSTGSAPTRRSSTRPWKKPPAGNMPAFGDSASTTSDTGGAELPGGVVVFKTTASHSGQHVKCVMLT